VIIARDEHLNLREALPLNNILQASERRSESGSGGAHQGRPSRGRTGDFASRAGGREMENPGAQGAAAKLAIPASTLTSRMKALRISRPR
jgi:hypothetical protein